jgi:hypothetical protein
MQITVPEYLMGRDKQEPLSPQQQINMRELLRRVNLLLLEVATLMPAYQTAVSSGYRPPSVNRRVGGAPNSAHLTCEAVDLRDMGGVLGKALMLRWPKLLEQYDLYMEDPLYTTTWVHLQTRPTRSGNRVFKP